MVVIGDENQAAQRPHEVRVPLLPDSCFSRIGRPLPKELSLRDLAQGVPAHGFQPSTSRALLQFGGCVAFVALSLVVLSHLPWYLLPLGWVIAGLSLTEINVIAEDCTKRTWTPSRALNAAFEFVTRVPLFSPVRSTPRVLSIALSCALGLTLLLTVGWVRIAKLWLLPLLVYLVWRALLRTLQRAVPSSLTSAASTAAALRCRIPKWLEVMGTGLHMQFRHDVLPGVPSYHFPAVCAALERRWGAYVNEPSLTLQSVVSLATAILASSWRRVSGVFAPPPGVVVDVDAAPAYMRTWNPFVKHGYRLCRSYSDCFRSLFYWHNCWLDAVTSALDVANSTACVAYALSHIDFSGDDALTWQLIKALAAFYIVSWLHAPFSVAYHLIGCSGLSYDEYLLWQRLDFLSIFASSLPLAYSLGAFTFYDSVLGSMLSVGGTACCLAVTAWCIGEEMTPKRRLRLTTYLVVCYLLPVFVEIGRAIVAADLASSPMWWGCGALLGLGFGAYTYATMMPEAIWNDCLVGSHALMHVGVHMAYFCEFRFILATYERMRAASSA
jgi:fatty acid desaturase/predicted membrane channel-forming protein YqfA (hemolysin III family)